MRQRLAYFHCVVAATLLFGGALTSPLSVQAQSTQNLPDLLPDPPQSGPALPDIAPQDEGSEEPSVALPGGPAADPASPAPSADDMDALFAELAQTEGEGWRRAQSDILRIWSRSGSAAMDMLYRRGEGALDEGDLNMAIGHLTALTDHAPDFAAGWQLRAVAFYMDGDFGPALADIAKTLELEPRHFGALTQLGTLLEELGDDENALRAYSESLKINPHQQEAEDAVQRLTQKMAGTDA